MQKLGYIRGHGGPALEGSVSLEGIRAAMPARWCSLSVEAKQNPVRIQSLVRTRTTILLQYYIASWAICCILNHCFVLLHSYDEDYMWGLLQKEGTLNVATLGGHVTLGEALLLINVTHLRNKFYVLLMQR